MSTKRPTPPKLCSRTPDDDLPDCERSETDLMCEVSLSYRGGACGVGMLQLFTSRGNQDRGGFVLKATAQDEGGSCIPCAMATEDGAELHISGEIEAETFINMLDGLVKMYRFQHGQTVEP